MKKNNIIFYIISFVLIIALGTGSFSLGKKEAIKENEKKKEMMIKTAYNDILKSYYNMLTEYKKGNFDTEYEYGGGPEELFRYTEATLKDVGYTIEDISGDGIPELIIGEIKKDASSEEAMIYDVFAFDNGKAINVIDGWSRNSYYLTTDNTFYHSGSNGADSSVLAEYALSEDGKSLTEVNNPAPKGIESKLTAKELTPFSDFKSN